MLWDECFTDSDIRRALENLPKDLHETYHRCLLRMDNNQTAVGHRVLAWICAAVKPFKSRQLLEALAIDRVTGSLNRDDMPQMLDVLRSCSNLIIRDENDQIILAHHSVRQFLSNYNDFTASFWRTYPYNYSSRDRSILDPGDFLKTLELELGRLCITHLSSPEYSRAVAAPSQAKTAIDVSQISGAVLSNFKLRPGKWLWTTPSKPKPLIISPHFRPKASVTPVNSRGLPDFFHFARDQWALLTRSMDETDPSWSQFKALALEPNLIYNIHPWRSIGISLDSHFSALLGWSINNNHLPLVEALIGSKNPRPRSDIFNLPLTSYESVLPMHFAAKHGAHGVFYRLISVCNAKKLDEQGRTPLHYACEMGHYQIMTTLLKIGTGPISLGDSHGRTAAALAAINGHHAVLRALLESDPKSRYRSDADGKTPLLLAATYDHPHCVAILINTVPWFDTDGNDVINQDAWLDSERKTALDIVLQKAVTLSGTTRSTERSSTKAEEILCNMLRYAKPSPAVAATAEMLIALGVSTKWLDSSGNAAIHHAARKGHEATVALLRDEATLLAKNSEGRLALHEAAAGGHNAIVSMTLLLGLWHLGLETTDKHLNNVLHLAARNGHTPCIEFLLQFNKIRPDAQNSQGATPLHLAAQGGHVTTVETLLKCSGINVNAGDINRETPLHYAARHRYVTTINSLLKCGGISVNARTINGETPLHLAAKGGYAITAETLLKCSGIEVNAHQDQGVTPLHLAAQSGHLATVEVLLKCSGIKVNAQNMKGETSLHLAAKGGRVTAVEALLKCSGINVNARTINGETPLHLAVQGGHYAAAEILIKHSEIDVNAGNSAHEVPLHLAATRGSHSTMRALLNHGNCDVNVPDRYQNTPLHYAVTTCAVDDARALLQGGAHVDGRNRGADTPLHQVVRNDRLADMTNLLLEHGADSKVLNSDREATLHLAAKAGSVENVRILLQARDIDTSAKNCDDKTAKTLALEYRNAKVIDLFNEYESRSRGSPRRKPST